MPNNIESRIKAIIIDKLCVPEESLTYETEFDSLGIDSLDAVELTMALEEEFGITISDEDFDTLKTFETVIRYIEKVIYKRDLNREENS